MRRSDLGLNIRENEVTPRDLFLSRRSVVAGLAAAGWVGSAAHAATAGPGKHAALASVPSAVPGAQTMEKLTPFNDVATYCNYYEFGTDKSDPARNAGSLKTRPWTVQVDGLVKTPKTFGIEDLLKLSPMEERIYRLRCVEGWSMVVPWLGYSLSALLKQVEPLGSAKYVEFTTLADRSQMPGLRSNVLQWPYTEGLRLDEAMHPLALLTFGHYGEVLPNANGAPVRMVLPWKYGFKSAKSIVRIKLVDKEPRTSWNVSAPQEYGFFSNVNPTVDHPRWSQASERRIPDDGLFAKKRKTAMFNGYEAQVGQMYAGMDLKKFY
jgi:methionine sulfoxide reductase catalytic subunit